MERHKRYDSYKNSGGEWLAEIPSHWEVKRLKFIATGSLEYGANEPAEFEDRDLPRYIRITDINEDGSLRDDTFRSLPEKVAEPYLLRSGDLLFARSGATVGKSFMYRESWGKACYAGYLIRLRVNPQIVIPDFVSYFAASSSYWNWISNVAIQATIQNVSAEKYANLSLTIPPLPEQHSIKNFLDRKTAEIDSFITNKEKLIALLNEQKSAIINRVVTRGINPDVKLKSSGVDWLGEIPRHWDIIKTKYVFRLVTEPAPKDNDLELLSIYTAIGVRPRKELEERGNKATTTDGYWIVKKGDFIVNKLLAWMGAIGLSHYDGVTSPAYDILRKTRPLNERFYDYLFRCGLYFPEFKRRSRGIMEVRLRLYFDELGQIPLALPSVEEQNKIVSYLDEETSKVDSAIQRTQKEIDLIKEYRQALISEAVTGKIDVR